MVIQRSVCAGHLCYETCPQLNEEVLKKWNGCNSSATTLFRTFTISMTSIHNIFDHYPFNERGYHLLVCKICIQERGVFSGLGGLPNCSQGDAPTLGSSLPSQTVLPSHP
jgi:hypothetical protein